MGYFRRGLTIDSGDESSYPSFYMKTKKGQLKRFINMVRRIGKSNSNSITSTEIEDGFSWLNLGNKYCFCVSGQVLLSSTISSTALQDHLPRRDHYTSTASAYQDKYWGPFSWDILILEFRKEKF